jgi:hypothetical protein
VSPLTKLCSLTISRWDGHSAKRAGGRRSDARSKLNRGDDGRAEVARADSTKTKTLQDCQKAHRDHGEAHHTPRRVMGKYKLLRTLSHAANCKSSRQNPSQNFGTCPPASELILKLDNPAW